MIKSKQKAVIIGAGMAGLSAAIKLLENGHPSIIIESQSEVGGLAGSFKIENKYFPIGYHHILSQDKPLIKMFKKMNIWDRISWKKIKVLFLVDNGAYNITNPIEFIRFPMPLIDKMRFIKLMIYCFFKKNWTKNLGNAQEWLDRVAGKNVRKIIFDPLIDIKYGLSSKYLSANWLGSRLHYQEFYKPLGYMPEQNWTRVLIEKMSERIQNLGGKIITNAVAKKIHIENGNFQGVTFYKNGELNDLEADILINTAPPHVFFSLCDYRNEKLENIRYLDALSLIIETPQALPREFYLLSCLSPRYSFGGIFVLSSLNKTLGTQKGTIINFFTNLSENYEYLLNKNPEELLSVYQNDFQKIFGFKLKPIWHHLALIKNYSPKFLDGYTNPDIRSDLKGIYFAGNYLTHPFITSTGSAIASGEKAADLIIEDCEKII